MSRRSPALPPPWRFARRVATVAGDNPLTLSLAARRAARQPVLDLTVSNPTQADIPYPAARLLAALAQPGSLRYEPDSAGLRLARQAIADRYRAQGVDLPPERLIVTCSTSEGYSHAFRLLANPGDHLLVPRPSYPLFEHLAQLHDLKLVGYDLRYDAGAWRIDPASLAAARHPRLKAILLVSPNNPTGNYLTQGELHELRDFCQGRLPIIVDEVFADYPLQVPGDHLHTLAGEREIPTLVLNGLSKCCGLPQVKLGWLALAGPPDFIAAARPRLELINDTFLSAATPVQHGVPELLAIGEEVRQAIHQRLRDNLASARALLADSAVSVLPVAGGWYQIFRLPATQSDERWAMALLAEGVLLHPGYFFDFPREAHLVGSLLTPPAIWQAGLAKLRALCERSATG